MAKVLGPTDGEQGWLGGIEVRLMAEAGETGGGFSLVEHPMPARSLAAPLHRHSREDEYSYVLEGRLGADLGGEVLYGEVGDLVFKPRDQWHTFWNPGDEPARILEIISPGGFEGYFAQMLRSEGPPDPAAIAQLAASYGLEIDFESVPGLLERHGLAPRGPPPD